MEDDIIDQMLAELDIDAFVSNLIDVIGITSRQQQDPALEQYSPTVLFLFDTASPLVNIKTYRSYSYGSIGRVLLVNCRKLQGHEEMDIHTTSTQPPTDGDENTQGEMEDDNAEERPIPCHKVKKLKVIKHKHVVTGRKYGTRVRQAALKAKFPSTSVDSPFNVD
nr:uncharacterized protein LOC109153444 [Ipomoea trifida]